MAAVKHPTTNPTNIWFTFDKNNLVRLMMETCQNMVKIASGNSGEPLVDEYAMSEDTPTMAMKQKILNTPLSDIVETLHYLTDSNFDTDYKSSLSDTGDIVVPIRYVDTMRDAQLQSMFDAMTDMLVYGSLIQWFSVVNADTMKTLCEKEYARQKTALQKGVKELYRKLIFDGIANYTLPSE